MGMYCEICKEETKYSSYNFLRLHLKVKHNISNKTYYDTYLKKDNEDVCKNENCNNKTKFHTMIDGYRKFCSTTCGVKSEKIRNKISNTLKLKENYNIKSNYWAYKTEEDSNIIKEKIRKSVVEKSSIIQEQRKITYSEKSELEIKNITIKTQQTIIERYGVDRKKIEDKRKATCINKYGVNNVIKSEKVRIKKEENGSWRKKEDISEWEKYNDKSNWNKRMWDYCNKYKLKQYGVFNCITNKTGLVRDHIYSRKNGFDNKVPPILLRHPCNCQFITMIENIIKRSKSDITLEDLCVLIENYKGTWHEQPECVEIVKHINTSI